VNGCKEEILKTKCIWQKLLPCVIVTTVIGKTLLLIHTLLVKITFLSLMGGCTKMVELNINYINTGFKLPCYITIQIVII
jgi:hypothetical protein